MLSVLAAIAPLDLPGWIWVLLLFNGLVWPHLAYQLAIRASEPYQAERRNLLYDSVMGGFWTATMQFNPLPAVTILSMMTMNNVAAGGQRLFVHGALAQVVGILLAITLFGPQVQLNVTALQIYACLPMLTLYPLALGWVCYRLAIKLADHKRRLSALSCTDSLTGLFNHGAWKDLLNVQFFTCRQESFETVIAVGAIRSIHLRRHRQRTLNHSGFASPVVNQFLQQLDGFIVGYAQGATQIIFRRGSQHGRRASLKSYCRWRVCLDTTSVSQPHLVLVGLS